MSALVEWNEKSLMRNVKRAHHRIIHAPHPPTFSQFQCGLVFIIHFGKKIIPTKPKMYPKTYLIHTSSLKKFERE